MLRWGPVGLPANRWCLAPAQPPALCASATNRISVPTSPRRRRNFMPPACGLLQLGARQPQHPARDDQLLDLLGALEDVEDLRVTRPLLEQLGLAVAHRAAQLDARQSDVRADPAG